MQETKSFVRNVFKNPSTKVELSTAMSPQIIETKYVRQYQFFSFSFIGPFQSGSDSTLQPGNYSFPFQFSLPPHSLPTSFEGVYGNIRYWLHAVVDRPWRKNLQVDSPIFIVERVQIRDPTLLVSLKRQ